MLEGHTEEIFSCAFNYEGNIILTGTSLFLFLCISSVLTKVSYGTNLFFYYAVQNFHHLRKTVITFKMCRQFFCVKLKLTKCFVKKLLRYDSHQIISCLKQKFWDVLKFHYFFIYFIFGKKILVTRDKKHQNNLKCTH